MPDYCVKNLEKSDCHALHNLSSNPTAKISEFYNSRILGVGWIFPRFSGIFFLHFFSDLWELARQFLTRSFKDHPWIFWRRFCGIFEVTVSWVCFENLFQFFGWTKGGFLKDNFKTLWYMAGFSLLWALWAYEQFSKFLGQTLCKIRLFNLFRADLLFTWTQMLENPRKLLRSTILQNQPGFFLEIFCFEYCELLTRSIRLIYQKLHIASIHSIDIWLAPELVQVPPFILEYKAKTTNTTLLLRSKLYLFTHTFSTLCGIRCSCFVLQYWAFFTRFPVSFSAGYSSTYFNWFLLDSQWDCQGFSWFRWTSKVG